MKKKKRMTFAKRVEAQSETLHALDVAQHGRVLSVLEHKLKNYLRFQTSEGSSIFRIALVNAILEAIDSRDLNSLRAIVTGVEEFSVTAAQVGSYRADIVAMKGVLDDCKQTMTIPYLAKLLHIQKTEDGFKTLRTLCKRLNFPIKDAKRGPAHAHK